MEKQRFETQLTFGLVYIILTMVILLSAIGLPSPQPFGITDRTFIRMTGAWARGIRRPGGTRTLRGNDEIAQLAETLTRWPSAWANSKSI